MGVIGIVITACVVYVLRLWLLASSELPLAEPPATVNEGRTVRVASVFTAATLLAVCMTGLDTAGDGPFGHLIPGVFGF